ncbi:MAG: GlsB/YeaQ/YmgE family stress response membrane protein [Nanoarchaeota archaeon]
MDLVSLIIFLVVGLIAGWLADLAVKGVGFGLLGDLIIGIVGAFIGGYIFGAFNIGGGGIFWSIVSAFVGAVVLLLVIKLIRIGTSSK